MSKYDTLFHHLSHSKGAVEMSFDEVEAMLGSPLPASARRHAAWWSNSGGTHVQADAWMRAGYRTENVDVVARRVRFVPRGAFEGLGEMKQAEFRSGADHDAADHNEKLPNRHPAWGAMKGMITLLPDVDLTAPAYEDWKVLYGEDE